MATLRPADGAVAWLFYVTVAVLFCISGGMLWSLGLNYDGISGSVASKLHPATYLGFLLLAALVVARRHPVALLAKLPERHGRTLVFVILTILQVAIILIEHRPNLGTAFDTYLLPAFLLIAMAELDERAMRRTEILIHVVMGLNALMAIAEFALDQRFFPYRFEGEAFETDTRSAALHGHPLTNAAVTGCYLVALLIGGGPALAGSLRLAMVVLQLAATVTFGGRTASLLIVAVLGAQAVARTFAVLGGARFRLRSAIAVAFLVPVAVVAIVALAEAGFFGSLVERFVSDGGSANARIGMVALFGELPFRDFLAGPAPDLVDSVRRLNGLEWGIENPVLRMLLYQGAVVTAFMIVGFALFMGEVGSYLRVGSWPLFLFFLIDITSFESIASKTTLLAKFVVLAVAMLRRGDWGTYLGRVRNPSAATMAGSGLRSSSLANSPNPSNRFQ